MAKIILSAVEKPYYERFCAIADELDIPLNHTHVKLFARAAARIAKSSEAASADAAPKESAVRAPAGPNTPSVPIGSSGTEIGPHRAAQAVQS
jgi:hypothetical protein